MQIVRKWLRLLLSRLLRLLLMKFSQMIKLLFKLPAYCLQVNPIGPDVYFERLRPGGDDRVNVSFVSLRVILEAERLFSLVCTNMEKRIILQTSMVRYRCQLIFEIMKNIFDYQNQFKFLCTNHVLNMPFI
jgi:hypothetical protein